MSPASEELQERVTEQTLLSQLAENEAPKPLEILSSAHSDYQRILAALYEDGYFSSVVSIKLDGREASDISTVTPPKSIARAVVTVQTGSEFKFGRTQIAPLARKTVLPTEFATGQTASTKVLEDTVKVAVSDWKDEGYPKVEPNEQKYTVNHNSNIFNAEVSLATGRQARIGNITVSGNQDVRSQRIIEIMGLEQGKVYSPEDIKDAENRLRRTDAFSSVILEEGETIDANGNLDFDAVVEEQLPRRFGFGAELSNEDGASLSTYWVHRNLMGGAERLKLSGEINGIGSVTEREEYNLTARFERPATFSRDTDFVVQGQALSKSEETYDLDRIGLAVGIKRYVSDTYEYEFVLAASHQREKDFFGEDEYTLFSGIYQGTLDKRDDPLRPTSGYYVAPSLLPFIGADGERSGLRSFVDARTYYSLGESMVMAFRGQIGSIYGSSIEDTPAGMLFYSGGSDTVRGFPYQSIGLQQNGVTVVGGRSFLGASAEFRYTRESGLGLVGFVDAGYIGAEEFPDGSSGEWHSGAGVGARYNTGLGPLRFDIATPIYGESSGGDIQIYIGIGEAF
ncbi:autotransporter assembly complex family protein [Falsihalocynthiibacter sp. SS001]|uniref:autotransporter assembly complex protein TamA n=1 Tax=Falsihalocynthiibacter sp. SS001 TaxID=3349698 RepID=UPI0036D20DD1